MTKLFWISLISFSFACAQSRQQRVIEPGSGGAASPAGSGASGRSGAATGGSGGDEAFLISRAPVKSEAPPADYPIHLAEKWFPFRAEYLGISPQEALSRDTAISNTEAPAKVWDEQIAIETVSIWGALCNECHGGRRRIKDALAMNPPTSGWGRDTGLFFGKRRPYRDIFKVISGGGPVRDGKQSEMPAWGQRLSREQIWALIYFLEYQSGGIEGVFPPSLYPRGDGN